MNQVTPVFCESLTLREAAALLKISERWLWQRVKDGDIPHIRMGRVIRLDPQDLHRWRDSLKQTGGLLASAPPVD